MDCWLPLPRVFGPVSSGTDKIISPGAVPPLTTAQPIAPVNRETTQKDADVEAIRKDSQEIKRKIAEQEPERNAQEQNGSSKQTPPSTP
jgi:hypothetical protein